MIIIWIISNIFDNYRKTRILSNIFNNYSIIIWIISNIFDNYWKIRILSNIFDNYWKYSNFLIIIEYIRRFDNEISLSNQIKSNYIWDRPLLNWIESNWNNSLSQLLNLEALGSIPSNFCCHYMLDEGSKIAS